MRAVIQRVSHSKVVVEGRTTGEIEKGLLVLLGVTHADERADIDWLIKKITNLRIFNDEQGKMNLSVKDIGGDILVVSQFTLYADAKKGNRPSYIRSAPPEVSIPMYENFVELLALNFEGKVATGEFGAMMEVSLLNDGPVTIILDSKEPGW
ncbi:MAG: D-aminoacyl-tRNA deacylase [Bacteroidia bacterium]|nr:D-aminoacyl-tRNA deacylase [Bacteroidia bacterium]